MGDYTEAPLLAAECGQPDTIVLSRYRDPCLRFIGSHFGIVQDTFFSLSLDDIGMRV